MHKPVLFGKLLKHLTAIGIPEKARIFDGTFGCGGYSKAFLNLLPRVQVYAVDRDPNTAPHAEKVLKTYPSRFIFEQCTFSSAVTNSSSQLLDYISTGKFDVAVLDLGLCSEQIDNAERGFSFQRKGTPLDMRMDDSDSSSIKAFDVLNFYSKTQLLHLFRNNSDFNDECGIGDAIIKIRRVKHLSKSEDLTHIIDRCLPRTYKFKERQKVKAQIFQALRMEVNSEVGL